MRSTSERASGSELLDEASDLGVGLGLLTMILFPFAVPFILLTAVVLAVVAVPALVGGLLVALLLGPPWLLVRCLRSRRRDEPTTPPAAPRHQATATEGHLVTGRLAAR
jgi:hypothetical protein